ncbi:MAG: hypothetical protein Q9160_008473 [Pyrenula sp. 1 TL-2023]
MTLMTPPGGHYIYLTRKPSDREQPTTAAKKIEGHDRKVAKIAGDVESFYRRRKAFRIYHGSTNSTRASQYRRDNIIDTSGLTNILRIDTDRKTALVEPNVAMDSLVNETIAHGLVPPVVMEFPGITAGGGFSGSSGESSSFRYGFFDRTIAWFEIVLADGERTTASSGENADLFWGAAAAFGTLGVITLLEIRLIEAKEYVSLTYHHTSSMAQAVEKMEEAAADASTEYIDGIAFARESIVVCTGRLADTVPEGTRIRRFTRPQDPWFFLHAQKLLRSKRSSASLSTESFPLRDYLFRYDRGGFWVGVYGFKYFLTPFNRVTRYLLDRYMHTRVMYHALHQSGLASRNIIQDVAVPYAASSDFLDWLHENTGLYPLWLCPLRVRGEASSSCSSASSTQSLLYGTSHVSGAEYLMNFGVWGEGPSNGHAFTTLNRHLEQKVRDLGGQKWLYAHAYYTEEEFWSIYDRGAYDALRAKYHAEHLPSIYDKVKVDTEAEERVRAERGRVERMKAALWDLWPVAGLYGVYKAWRGGDYLLPKERKR